MWKIKKSKVIVFDVGGTHLRSGVVDFSGKKSVIYDWKKEKLPINKKRIGMMILQQAKKISEKHNTRQVAIASAGIADNNKKTVFQAAQCYGKDIFSFAFLEKEGMKVFLENDGKAFVWGWQNFEARKKYNSVLAIIMGTGIGGGLIVNDKIWRGRNYSAMEIGRTFFRPSLFPGRLLQWEGFFGGKGIENNYFQLSGQQKRAEEIFDLAEKGDNKASIILQEGSEIFSLGLANLINILDPETIVLGGEMVKTHKKHFQKLVENSRQWIFNKKSQPKLFFSSLGEKANLLGVADLSRR